MKHHVIETYVEMEVLLHGFLAVALPWISQRTGSCVGPLPIYTLQEKSRPIRRSFTPQLSLYQLSYPNCFTPHVKCFGRHRKGISTSSEQHWRNGELRDAVHRRHFQNATRPHGRSVKVFSLRQQDMYGLPSGDFHEIPAWYNFFVKNSSTEFHKNSTKYLIADTRSRVDGWAWPPHRTFFFFFNS